MSVVRFYCNYVSQEQVPLACTREDLLGQSDLICLRILTAKVSGCSSLKGTRKVRIK